MIGWNPTDPVWDRCGWLDDLRVVPEEAVWPRLMSGPHPLAVGSYGPGAAAWLAEEAGMPMRWWQRLALCRLLEHDAAGALVWLELLLSTSRQVGKSYLLRGIALWRMHHPELFGGAQLVLHTARDLPVAREVQRPARAWAKERREAGYVVREANGSEEIRTPADSRWLVRARGSLFGYSVDLGLADEAWGIDAEVIEDALEPTMPERTWPQLVLVSTAHRKTTPLFPGRRSAALAALDAPGSTLLIEWSAAPDAELDDRAAWRAASPHWSPGRERLLEAKLARAEQGRSDDEDEPDAAEAFRSQWLNQWRARRVPVAAARDEPLVDPAAWAAATDLEAALPPAGLIVALEDFFGQGAAVACAGRLADGRVIVTGDLFPGRRQACGWAGQQLAAHPGSRLLVGASLVTDPAVTGIGAPVESAGAAETRSALPLLRQLLADGRLVHDGGPDLVGQAAGLRVVARESGLAVSPRSGRSDLARCAVWAAAEAAREPVTVERSMIWV